MTSVMRPDPRYELALASQVPHIQTEHLDTSAVAVTNLVNIWFIYMKISIGTMADGDAKSENLKTIFI